MENTTASLKKKIIGQGVLLTAIFKDRASAEKAYDLLKSRGYKQNEINVIMSDNTRKKHFDSSKNKTEDTELGNKALEGTGAGSAIGGAVGAIAGAIAAIGTTIAVPGLGLLIAGPIAGALAGAGAGGVTGGLIGALIGAGIPEDRAKVYETGIKEGGIVVGVEARSTEDADYFQKEWKNYNAEHLSR